MSGLLPAPAIVNRILVVEDDRDEAEFLKVFLQQHKIDVEIARDGGQAQAAFTMHPPDVVILDLILPNNVSGFEVCEQFKHLNPDVPILVLTAIDMDDARDLAQRVGANGYVTKPYDPDNLLRLVHDIADEQWARRHLDDATGRDEEKIRFFCGGCGKKLKASPQHRGRTVNCPRCGQAAIVPRHD